MRFEVLNVQWTADDETFGGGVHDVKKPTATFLRLLAGAEAAGAVKVLDAAGNRAKLNQHVITETSSSSSSTPRPGSPPRRKKPPRRSTRNSTGRRRSSGISKRVRRTTRPSRAR
jgi:hypothetical protein